MTSYHAAEALLPNGLARDVRIVVTDGVIGEVAVGAGPQPHDVLLPGLVMPGVANAHSHLFHRALRGRTHGGGGTFWTWREEMYRVAARLDPDLYHLLARAVLLEMAQAGYTVVGEFHYLHHQPGGRPYADPNAMGRAIIDAAGQVGIRLTLLDTCYLNGGLSAQGYAPPDPTQLRYADAGVQGWAARVAALDDGPLVRIGAAAHSVRALDPAQLARFARESAGKVVHAHVSEQPAENTACLAAHGKTPVELLDDTGLLGGHFTAVHATHLSAHDIDLLAGAGAGVCACPTTERDLADGIGPFRALHDAGVRLSIGSDQNIILDPFEEIRGVEMHERLRSGERGRFSPAELGAIAGENGYAQLGWAAGGRIEVGALADVISVRTDSRRTAGAAPDQLAFAAGAPDVTDVVVGGEHIVRDRRHRLGEVDALLVEALQELRQGMP